MVLQIPSPKDCFGIVGVMIGFLGGLVGLGLVAFTDVTPWGFVLLALSGWVAFSSVFYCILWEWEHLG